MDKIRDIIIKEVVLHVLDNSLSEPVLNNYKMELNEELYKFVLGHIERVLKDDNLKYALFKSKDTEVKKLSQDFLNGMEDIVLTSKGIAEQLFETMKNDLNISSGDLLVVSFDTEYGPMLGIIKLDYVKQYTHKIDSSIGIKIMSIATGLPATKKVQKAAFIKPINQGQDYNLLVLDKQMTKDVDNNDFLNNFLGCNLINNDRDKTRAFIDAVEIWTRSNLQGQAAKAEQLRSSIKDQLKANDEIDIYDLAAEVLPFGETQKNFLAYMQQNELEDIKIDKEYLAKKLSKIKIKVSSDIDLSITEEAYKDINKFEIVNNGDGSIHMLIKNIENYAEK